MRHRNSFIADQRGAVAFEMPIVCLFLMMSLLLPLADLAIAGFQFVSAWEALRDLRAIFAVPFATRRHERVRLDVKHYRYGCTVIPSAIPSRLRRYGHACSPSNTASPKYYSYTTTVTLSPMVLRPVLCSSTNAIHARSHCLTQNGFNRMFHA